MAHEFKKSMSQKLRMDGCDYSRPGWYFLTLGADYHRPFFGRVDQGEMRPSKLGRLVERCWREIPEHYPHIELGAWQVMPNHFHGLIRIARPGGKGLGEVVNVFKGAVTREARRSGLLEVSRYSGKDRGGVVRVWAPNYYDVICFDADELAVREKYVRDNPRRWSLRDVPHGRWQEGFYRGNVELLKTDLPRRALRVSRRSSQREIEGLQREIAAFEGVVFSTFYSAGERACLETVLGKSAGIVWVVPMALPVYIPPVWTDAFLEGRALWISRTDLPEACRLSCEAANRFAAELASGQ